MNTRIKYTIYLQLLATKWFLKLRNTRENKKSEEEVRLGHGADDQSRRRHLSCRWIGPLPWAHLPLPRVSCARSLPGTPLRPTATSERRSPDRDVEPRTCQHSTHRSVATHRQALCRSARYRGAIGGVGER